MVTMSIELPLESLSVAEKVRLLEDLWESLCKHSGDVKSPEWHREILDSRKKQLEQGQARLCSWDEAKSRFLQVGR